MQWMKGEHGRKWEKPVIATDHSEYNSSVLSATQSILFHPYSKTVSHHAGSSSSLATSTLSTLTPWNSNSSARISFTFSS